MSLLRLDIKQLRSITATRVMLHPRYNVFYGANGSGKTSILEAVYLLGSGYSFRTRDTMSLVSHGHAALNVVARMHAQDRLSLHISRGGTSVRLNQRTCARRSELATLLPCQVFHHDLFAILEAGPCVRRSLLDWGLFHVKQEYHALWKDYRRVLKQRNTLLRQQARYALFEPWDKQLMLLSEALDTLREAYCREWFMLFDTVLHALTPLPCVLRYEKGWDKKKTGKRLDELLKAQFETDLQRQYTHSGAHHADILFDSSSLKAKQQLSRGQQKIVLIALKLAQAQLLTTPCVYLFDDMTAELDAPHIDRLFRLLATVKGQFMFTTLDPQVFRRAFDAEDISFFSVDQGQLMLGSSE